MRHFYLMLVVSLVVVVGCKHPRKFPQRPTLPIMRVVGVSSSIVYPYTLEAEANELPADITGIRIVLIEDNSECQMDRDGACAMATESSDKVEMVAYGTTAAGEQINICDPNELTLEIIHRSETVGSSHFFPRILAREVEVRRVGGQCVFALTDPPAMFSSLK